MSEKWIDTLWKSVLIEGFDDALLFFMPELAEVRDFSHATELLAEELPVIGAKSDGGMRISDVAFSIPVQGGAEQRVAFVIEQQHAHDREFALRMYEGFYRMTDRMRVLVTSLAIFTGNAKEVDRYEYACFGTELLFKYNSYSVAKADIEVLRRDERVFAVVVLAAALMLRAGGDPANREKYARGLLHLLRERDYTVTKKKMILKFVGSVFQVQKDDISRALKEEWNMIRIPLEEAIERIKIQSAFEEGMEMGMEKGVKMGMDKDVTTMARKMLAFGVAPELIAKASGLPEDEIRALQ